MKRQESRHKKQKRTARARAKSRQPRGPRTKTARTNVRQADFRVVARGERRESPDIERIADAIWHGYLAGDFDEMFERLYRDKSRRNRSETAPRE